MQPALNATLTLPQLRELCGPHRWRVLYVGADDHLAALECVGDPSRIISRNVDREAVALLRALKAAGRPFEVSTSLGS
jgi:hypothetical protein